MKNDELLADIIINHSLETKKDEKIILYYETKEADNLVKEIIKKANEKEASVYLRYTDPKLDKLLKENLRESVFDVYKNEIKFDVANFDSFIAIRCNVNDYEYKNVNDNMLGKLNKLKSRYNDIKINNRKWVLLNYPSDVEAYKAKMTYDDYKNFSYSAMCEDYDKMQNDIRPLKLLMETTDKVRLTGVDTDITFSIKDMPIIPCCGEKNIPDGEIYCAPVKKSVNGYIKYNTPSPYRGEVFHGVKLTFKDGKIIDATCDEKEKQDKLNEIFNTDAGARYVGEFSIGLNPKIKHPIGNILFDEKIIGSIHFTPGMAYKDSYNGNSSSIHWDMVLIQRKDYGGGDIYFDDVLIRKDGKFVISDLLHLNK